MQFSIDKNALLSHIQKVSKASPVRSTMAILNCILFEVKGNNLNLRTSDIEITMSTLLDVNGVEDGSVAVPTRTILELINEAEEGEITFKSNEEGNVNLSSGKGIYEVMGRPGVEFPNIPNVVELNKIQIDNGILYRMIHKSIFAVSKDELKPALMGVLFQIKDDEIISVATDGHRLVKLTRKDYKSDGFVGNVIIPTKFLNLIMSYISSEGETVLTIGENHVKVDLNSTTIYSRIIDEQFPDYESVIPTKNDKIMKTDVNKLISTIRRVSIFSNRTTHQISLAVNKDKTKVSTVDQETMSSADEEIDVEYEGDDIVIGYNANYIREVLKNVDSDNVILKLASPISACLVLPEDQQENEDLVMLIMPIRLTEKENYA